MENDKKLTAKEFLYSQQKKGEKEKFDTVSSDSPNIPESDMYKIISLFVLENWKNLGYTPIITLKLLERGWEYQELQEALSFLIGKDFASINITIWIKRLEAIGIVIPEDDVPFLDFMDLLILNYIQQKEFKEIE
jgi:hypothetical protein